MTAICAHLYYVNFHISPKTLIFENFRGGAYARYAFPWIRAWTQVGFIWSCQMIGFTSMLYGEAWLSGWVKISKTEQYVSNYRSQWIDYNNSIMSLTIWWAKSLTFNGMWFHKGWLLILSCLFVQFHVFVLNC